MAAVRAGTWLGALALLASACTGGGHHASPTTGPGPSHRSGTPSTGSTSASPSPTPPPPVVVQAETMQLPADKGVVDADPSASGGKELEIWADAAATASVTAPAGGRLTVRARANACEGGSTALVSVDGRQVAAMAFSGAAWTTRAAATPWPGGTHQVRVAFSDDYKTAACDRNLRVDDVSVTRAPVPAGATAPVAAAIGGDAAAFGMSAQGPNAGVASAAAVSRRLGRHLDVVNFYQAWSTAKTLPVADLQRITAEGAEPEITWEPWDPRKGAHGSTYSLASITAGKWDAYITTWARAAAAYHRPLLLRWGHEMNGNWYPWAPGATGTAPSAYVAAYRHVHDLFTAAGARNVRWVWSPNIVQGMRTSLASVWPGNGYVDVIGVDGYNGGTAVRSMGGWRSPSQVFGATLAQLAAQWPTVPVMINETGSSESGGSKADWIRQLFDYLPTTAVTAVVWFDLRGQGDWPVTTSASSASAMKHALTAW